MMREQMGACKCPSHPFVFKIIEWCCLSFVLWMSYSISGWVWPSQGSVVRSIRERLAFGLLGQFPKMSKGCFGGGGASIKFAHESSLPSNGLPTLLRKYGRLDQTKDDPYCLQEPVRQGWRRPHSGTVQGGEA